MLGWLVSSLLLGGSTGGVFTGSTYNMDASGNPDPNQVQPNCVSVHTWNARAWGSFETIRYDVWVNGCNASSGKLELSTPLRCTARSFLGPAAASCTAALDGNRLKVSVSLSYPIGLGLLAGYPNPSTFYVDPGGGYSTY